MVGALIENGIYKLSASSDPSSSLPFTLTPNPHSWHFHSHMLYIDQPIGTGYSFTPSSSSVYETNQTTLASHLLNALIHFFTDPESPHHSLLESQLYITGESYAGKYIPSLATTIVKHNQKVLASSSSSLPYLRLAGIAMGNSLVSPHLQRFAYRLQSHTSGLLFSSSSSLSSFSVFERRCERELIDGNMEKAAEVCGEMIKRIQVESGKINMYDGRTYEDTYNKTLMLSFLNDASVREVFHLSPSLPLLSSTCSSSVLNSLSSEIMTTTAPLLPFLLSSSLRIVIYSGSMDLRDGTIGTEMWLNHDEMKNEKWKEREKWKRGSERFVWKKRGTVVEKSRKGQEKWDAFNELNMRDSYGYIQEMSGSNLTFAVIHSSGHFAPANAGEATEDMIHRLLHPSLIDGSSNGVMIQSNWCDASAAMEVLREAEVGARADCVLLSELMCDGIKCLHGKCQLQPSSSSSSSSLAADISSYTSAGRCLCDVGWSGADCSVPVVDISSALHLTSKEEAVQSYRMTTTTTATGETMVEAHCSSFVNDSMTALQPQDSTLLYFYLPKEVIANAESSEVDNPLYLYIHINHSSLTTKSDSSSGSSNSNGNKCRHPRASHLQVQLLFIDDDHTDANSLLAQQSLSTYDRTNFYFNNGKSSVRTDTPASIVELIEEEDYSSSPSSSRFSFPPLQPFLFASDSSFSSLHFLSSSLSVPHHYGLLLTNTGNTIIGRNNNGWNSDSVFAVNITLSNRPLPVVLPLNSLSSFVFSSAEQQSQNNISSSSSSTITDSNNNSNNARSIGLIIALCQFFLILSCLFYYYSHRFGCLSCCCRGTTEEEKEEKREKEKKRRGGGRGETFEMEERRNSSSEVDYRFHDQARMEEALQREEEQEQTPAAENEMVDVEIAGTSRDENNRRIEYDETLYDDIVVRGIDDGGVTSFGRPRQVTEENEKSRGKGKGGKLAQLHEKLKKSMRKASNQAYTSLMKSDQGEGGGREAHDNERGQTR